MFGAVLVGYLFSTIVFRRRQKRRHGRYVISILAVCPNAHAMKVKDKYAGMMGLCPICRARMKVPKPGADVLTGNSAVDVLHPQDSDLSGLSLDTIEFTKDDTAFWTVQHRDDAERVCAKCHEIIPTDSHVCPHCRAYVAKLNE